MRTSTALALAIDHSHDNGNGKYNGSGHELTLNEMLAREAEEENHEVYTGIKLVAIWVALFVASVTPFLATYYIALYFWK